MNGSPHLPPDGFSPQYVAPKGPLREPHVDFDFGAVAQALGEPAASESGSADIAPAVRRILMWLVAPPKLPGADPLQITGAKVLRLAWALDRRLIQGPRLIALARQLRRRERMVKP